MYNIFISGDFHLFHQGQDPFRGIIPYCNRPFEDVHCMYATIVNNFNAIVGPQDVVYHVGDFSFYKPWSDIIKHFNGTWVFLWGNHDFKRLNGIPLHRAIEIRRRGRRIYINHHPQECMEVSGFDLYLTAHIHEKWLVKDHPTGRKIVNVGVDVHNFQPVTLDYYIKNFS